MQRFYREANIKELQRLCFRASSFPELAMPPKDAYEALVANDVDYVPLEGIKGRISATLALIYPPGIGVMVPGERWDEKAQPMLDYFLAFRSRLTASLASTMRCRECSKNGSTAVSSFTPTLSANECHKRRPRRTPDGGTARNKANEPGPADLHRRCEHDGVRNH